MIGWHPTLSPTRVGNLSAHSNHHTRFPNGYRGEAENWFMQSSEHTTSQHPAFTQPPKAILFKLGLPRSYPDVADGPAPGLIATRPLNRR